MPRHMPIQKNVVEHYHLHHSVNETAKEFCISAQTVRRILITNGIYLSERSREVARLRLMGMTVQQIAEYLKLDEKVVKIRLPYTKGSYAVGEKSLNAERIAKIRARKKRQEDTDNAKD